MIRYIFNTIKIIVLIFILLFLAFVINNWGDEELNPEVAKALDWKAPEHTFEDNGYLILLGIEAPSDVDAAAVGKKVLEAELARFVEVQKTHKEPHVATQAAISPYIDWKDNRCEYTTQKNCVDYYLQMGAAKLTFVISSQDRLVKRFQAIKQSKYYVEAFTPLYSSSFPSYKNLVLASELERIQAILDISEGKTAQGITRFIENAAFSRRLLRESNTLVAHMIAVALMQRDTRILSELLVKYPTLAKQYYTQLATVLAPISASEFNLAKPLRSERDMGLQTFSHLKYASASELGGDKNNKFNQIWMWFGFQSNSTLNDTYTLSKSLQEMANADAIDLDKLKETHKQQYVDYFQMDHTLFIKKNPVGRILVSIAAPNYSDYIERQHDLSAYLAIVNVQLQILANEKPDSKLVLTLQNPYTREVMPFDKDTGTLTFEGRQPSNTNFNKSKQYQVKLQ
jgi:hypothetical protein